MENISSVVYCVRVVINNAHTYVNLS